MRDSYNCDYLRCVTMQRQKEEPRNRLMKSKELKFVCLLLSRSIWSDDHVHNGPKFEYGKGINIFCVGMTTQIAATVTLMEIVSYMLHHQFNISAFGTGNGPKFGSALPNVKCNQTMALGSRAPTSDTYSIYQPSWKL